MPLAFSDQSLARLVTAASRISIRKRSRWLQEIAKQLDTDSRSRNAEWCRLSRERAKNGVVAFRVVLDRLDLIEMLTTEKLLASGGLVDPTHAEIERALQYFLTELIAVSSGDSTVGQ